MNLSERFHQRQCSSCGAPIVFLETVTGRVMPVDPEPVSTGNLRVVGDRAEAIGGDPTLFSGDELRYVSHFATCPNASEHRR